jgi:hypothetical protein
LCLLLVDIKNVILIRTCCKIHLKSCLWLKRSFFDRGDSVIKQGFFYKIDKYRIPKEGPTRQNWKCCRLGLIESVQKRYWKVQHCFINKSLRWVQLMCDKDYFKFMIKLRWRRRWGNVLFVTSVKIPTLGHFNRQKRVRNQVKLYYFIAFINNYCILLLPSVYDCLSIRIKLVRLSQIKLFGDFYQYR